MEMWIWDDASAPSHLSNNRASSRDIEASRWENEKKPELGTLLKVICNENLEGLPENYCGISADLYYILGEGGVRLRRVLVDVDRTLVLARAFDLQGKQEGGGKRNARGLVLL